MATVLSPPEERIILHDVSWETYESLLADHQDRSAPRFTYDRGVLEIMSPSSEHEEISDLIKQMVYTLAGEMNLDIRGFGSTTFRREDIKRGFEPDACFYIQSVERIRGVTKLALAIHPPPDLVVEIDITHPSLDKFPIYAQVRVPEVWRYDGQKLTIFLLLGERYVEAEESGSLPRVTGNVISRFLDERQSRTLPEWLDLLREWARSSLKHNGI
jgi:Uma2 family endonuclease